MLFLKEMISILERIFYIPENGIHPFERRMRDRLFSASNDMRLMDTSCIRYSIKTCQPVGNDSGSRLKIPHAPMLKLFFTKTFDFRKLDSLWPFVHISFYRCNKRGFSSRTAPSFSAYPFTAQIGIVNFNATMKLFLPVLFPLCQDRCRLGMGI